MGQGVSPGLSEKVLESWHNQLYGDCWVRAEALRQSPPGLRRYWGKAGRCELWSLGLGVHVMVPARLYMGIEQVSKVSAQTTIGLGGSGLWCRWRSTRRDMCQCKPSSMKDKSSSYCHPYWPRRTVLVYLFQQD